MPVHPEVPCPVPITLPDEDQVADDEILHLVWEMHAGKRWGILVDDTGNYPSPIDGKTITKAAVAVIGGPHNLPCAIELLHLGIDGLVELTDQKEFHLSDLFGGRNDFAGLDMATRLRLVQYMTWIFTYCKLQVVDFAYEPKLHADEVRAQLAARGFDEHYQRRAVKWEHQTLVQLSALALRVIGNDPRPKTMMTDTWNRLVETGTRFLGCEVLDPQAAIHVSPSRASPIQLADFAAWAMARMNHLKARAPLTSEWDQETAKTLRPLAGCFVTSTVLGSSPT